MKGEDYSFGIDLGTTNSLMAYYHKGAISLLEIDGDVLIPSLLGVTKEGDIIIGKEAKVYAENFPEDVIFSNKRYIGDAQSYLINGRSLTAIEVSSQILNYLVENAEKQLGFKVNDVVITVPAYFNDLQRKNTILSAQSIGLKVRRLINEPTAASLAYRHLIQKNQELQFEEQFQNWLIYDLGGGTFDVSIIKVQNDGHNEVVVSMGDNFLGGDDFDSHLLGHLKNKIFSIYGKDVFFSVKELTKLKMYAEKIKWSLSSGNESVDFLISNIWGDQFNEKIIIKNKIFESLISNLVDKTLETIDQTLEMAQLSKREIKRLIFVGGSTEIPFVRKKVESYLNLKSDRKLNPHNLVALGAAIQSSISKGLNFKSTIIDIAPHSLGLAVIGEFDGHEDFYASEEEIESHDDIVNRIKDYCRKPPKTFVPVIEKMSKLPAVFVKKFFIGHDKQRFIPLALYQGESCYNEENSLVGIYVVEFEPLKRGDTVKIEMRYDLNGTVAVRICVGEDQDQANGHSFKVNLYDHNGETKIISKNSDLNQDDTQANETIKNEVLKNITEKKLGDDVDLMIKDYMSALIDGNNTNADFLESEFNKLINKEEDSLHGDH